MNTLSRRFLMIGLLLEFSGLFATGLGSWLADRAEREKADEEFSHLVDRGEEAIEVRLDQYQQALRNAVALHDVVPTPSFAQWERYVKRLQVDQRLPGINGIGHISPLHKDDTAAYLALQRSMHPEFAIRRLSQDPDDTLYVIDRIEPFDRNRKALGLDVGSERNRHDAANRARDLGEIAITRIVVLVQDKSRHPGFLMLVPLYRDGAVPTTPALRKERFAGWVYAPFVGQKTLSGIAEALSRNLCFDVYDGIPDSTTRIFQGCKEGASWARTRITRNQVGGNAWTVVWKQTQAKDPVSSGSLAILLLGGANFFGVLWVVFALHRYARTSVAQAQAAVREKDEFLAVMSHEIRTPLNGLLGTLGLIESFRLDPDSRRKVAVAKESGKALHALVNDILDFSRLQEGQLELEHIAFVPSEVLASCIAVLEPVAADKGLDLRWKRTREPGAYLGDPLRLRQVAMNLLGNAVKFTAQGSVELLLDESGTGLVLEVRDTGIGMDAEGIARLFQPFVQLESSTVRRFGGSGLGLSIVKRLIERMGGTIEVESEVGKGSVFRVELPLESCPMPEPPSEPEPDSQMPLPRHDGLRVLAVDDNPVNLMVLIGQLEKMGCEVEQAVSGEQAVESALAEDWDVIFMDCRMPGMDGLEATRQIRKAGSTVPIVALTANAQRSDREECLAAGMQHFLTKPLQSDEILAVLTKLDSRQD